MPAPVLLIIASIVFIAAYIWYGSFLNRTFDIRADKETPAHTNADGVDYVPARTPVLMGHHFSSIAGAGPILGPIFAAVFGWVPVFLWILVGSVFVGGVHDYASLVASIRHEGRSIGEVIELHIGKTGKRLFLIFAWFALVLIIAVFCKVVASTFINTPAAATSSGLFIVLAVVFGFGIYRLKFPLGLSTLVGVILLAGCVALGVRFPPHLGGTVSIAVLQAHVSLSSLWIIILLAYVFVAAVTPVWVLLQPRDFLNSFLLYFILLAGLLGIFVSGPKMDLPAFTEFNTDLGPLFPLLFVTVACGAISGFHSLVASGTSSKQLDRETDARPVGYGSMLIEGLLAVVALITAITVVHQNSGQFFQAVSEKGPITVFSNGIGQFVSVLGIPVNLGITFASLAISAFCLTTLDTATRLARFIFQEFFEKDNKKSILSNRYAGTLITVVFSALLAFSGTSSTLWPVFGSANQLLAAIALLAITVWLAELGKKTLFVAIPMVIMFIITLTALGSLIVKNMKGGFATLSIFSILLFGVTLVLIIQAFQHFLRMKKT